MTEIYPTIRTMTFEEASVYGYCHQGLMLEHGCVSYRLNSGASDNVHVFTSGASLLVLTINTRLDYIGLDFYLGKEEEPLDSIFLQGDAAREMIGSNWQSLSLSNLAHRLLQLFV